MLKIWINKLIILPREVLILVIKAYQKTLSPDHGLFAYKHPHGYCKYSPTCSDYALQSLNKYGAVKGGAKSLVRIIKCNPFSRGGFDPIDLNK